MAFARLEAAFPEEREWALAKAKVEEQVVVSFLLSHKVH
jgi:hypothetical protein